MEWIKSRLPKISHCPAILLAFVLIIPVITALAMSGMQEENAAIDLPFEEAKVSITTDTEPEEAVHALLILEEEAKPLQDASSVEEIVENTLESTSEAEEVPRETENEEDSRHAGEADTRERLTEPPIEPLNGQIIGNVSVPSVGLSDKLAVGTSIDGAQKVLEASAAIMCYEYMGLPENSPVSVVGGHNYMELNKLKNVKVGDDVLLELDWGVYEYIVYDILIIPVLDRAPRNNLILYTCHPFDERDNPTENAYFLCKPKLDSSGQASAAFRE